MKRIFTIFMSVIMLYEVSMCALSNDADTYLSEEIQQYCEEIGEEYCICPELLMAIIEKESRGQADAENGGCKGLCQISEKWHKNRMERLGVDDIYDPYSNILVCADYLSELNEKHGDIGVSLGAYHGEKNPENKISSYTKWILERSEQLERIHGK